MANKYNIGTLIQVNATFQNQSGQDADPTTVTAYLKDPSGIETQPTVTKDATGQYHFQFTPSLAGVHYYGWVGTGGVSVAGQSSFVVSPNYY